MTWTVGLGVGMWAAAVFQDSLVPLPIMAWGALAMLHVLLPHVAWNTSWKGPNSTKSQPPSEVWDFGQNPTGTEEVTLGEELNSVSEAE